jgi:hypothetical protein
MWDVGLAPLIAVARNRLAAWLRSGEKWFSRTLIFDVGIVRITRLPNTQNVIELIPKDQLKYQFWISGDPVTSSIIDAQGLTMESMEAYFVRVIMNAVGGSVSLECDIVEGRKYSHLVGPDDVDKVQLGSIDGRIPPLQVNAVSELRSAAYPPITGFSRVRYPVTYLTAWCPHHSLSATTLRVPVGNPTQYSVSTTPLTSAVARDIMWDAPPTIQYKSTIPVTKMRAAQQDWYRHGLGIQYVDVSIEQDGSQKIPYVIFTDASSDFYCCPLDSIDVEGSRAEDGTLAPNINPDHVKKININWPSWVKRNPATHANTLGSYGFSYLDILFDFVEYRAEFNSSGTKVALVVLAVDDFPPVRPDLEEYLLAYKAHIGEDPFDPNVIAEVQQDVSNYIAARTQMLDESNTLIQDGAGLHERYADNPKMVRTGLIEIEFNITGATYLLPHQFDVETKINVIEDPTNNGRQVLGAGYYGGHISKTIDRDDLIILYLDVYYRYLEDAEGAVYSFAQGALCPMRNHTKSKNIFDNALTGRGWFTLDWFDPTTASLMASGRILMLTGTDDVPTRAGLFDQYPSFEVEPQVVGMVVPFIYLIVHGEYIDTYVPEDSPFTLADLELEHGSPLRPIVQVTPGGNNIHPDTHIRMNWDTGLSWDDAYIDPPDPYFNQARFFYRDGKNFSYGGVWENPYFTLQYFSMPVGFIATLSGADCSYWGNINLWGASYLLFYMSRTLGIDPYKVLYVDQGGSYSVFRNDIFYFTKPLPIPMVDFYKADGDGGFYKVYVNFNETHYEPCLHPNLVASNISVFTLDKVHLEIRYEEILGSHKSFTYDTTYLELYNLAVDQRKARKQRKEEEDPFVDYPMFAERMERHVQPEFAITYAPIDDYYEGWQVSAVRMTTYRNGTARHEYANMWEYCSGPYYFGAFMMQKGKSMRLSSLDSVWLTEQRNGAVSFSYYSNYRITIDGVSML